MEITSSELTSNGLTTQEMTTNELTTQPLTTQELTTAYLTTQEMTTQPLTSMEMTTQPVTSMEMTTKPMTTSRLTTQPVTSQRLTTKPMTTKPMTSQPLTSGRLTTKPLTTQELTTKPLTSNSLTTQALIIGAPSVRFVNTIPNTNLTIYTDVLNTFYLAYGVATQYMEVNQGSVVLTNVLNGTASLSNGNPLMVTFGAYVVEALIISSSGIFTPVQFSESLNPGNSFNETSKAYIRMIVLGNDTFVLSMASDSGSIFSYVSYLTATPFLPVSPSISSIRIFDSAKSYNNPILILPVSLMAGKVYTVYYFNGMASIYYDHELDGSVNPPVGLTTGWNSALTAPLTTKSFTSNQMTSSILTTVEITSQSVVQNQETGNGSSKLSAFFTLILLVMTLLL